MLQAASAGFAIVLLTHQRKDDGKHGEAVRGSNALAGAVDIIVELERAKGALGEEEGIRVLHGTSRFSATPEKLAIVLDENHYSVCDTDGITAEQVLDALDEEWRAKDEIRFCIPGGMRQEALITALARLVEAGVAERKGTGRKGDPFQWRRSPGWEQSRGQVAA